VAPVVEKGATSRRAYLPKGGWFDFWTNERVQGGREIERPVDLETMPLYVREGAILPMGPVKQFVTERVDQPTTLTVYPGSDGSFLLYEDDGASFRHRKGEWMGVRLDWKDSASVLTMSLEHGSKMLSGAKNFEVRVGDEKKSVEFRGAKVEVKI
jgi:alpha-glucosidase/alpha-D-xyloside xylohydrolase